MASILFRATQLLSLVAILEGGRIKKDGTEGATLTATNGEAKNSSSTTVCRLFVQEFHHECKGPRGDCNMELTRGLRAEMLSGLDIENKIAGADYSFKVTSDMVQGGEGADPSFVLKKEHLMDVKGDCCRKGDEIPALSSELPEHYKQLGSTPVIYKKDTTDPACKKGGKGGVQDWTWNNGNLGAFKDDGSEGKELAHMQGWMAKQTNVMFSWKA